MSLSKIIQGGIYMNILDRITTGITGTIDVIVEKNRQLAQLNRLAVIIRNEKAVLDHAYINLGKQYYKILEKNGESADTEQIREVIRFTEARLKKAQARYDYIKLFGMPVGSAGDVEMKRAVDSDCDECEVKDETPAEEELEDITIAVADESEVSESTETAEVNPEEKVTAKKTASRKKGAASVDTEAADDE